MGSLPAGHAEKAEMLAAGLGSFHGRSAAIGGLGNSLVPWDDAPVPVHLQKARQQPHVTPHKRVLGG
jgi:hypothetical protein